MKKKFKALALILALVQLLSTTPVFATSFEYPYNVDDEVVIEEALTLKELEELKEKNLTSAKKQLEEQGKENMYYIFEKYIEDEYNQLKQSITSNSVTPYALTYYDVPSGKSGSITFSDSRTEGTVIGLNKTESQSWYREAKRASLWDFVTYFLVPAIPGIGAVLDFNAMAQSLFVSQGWDNVMDGSGRARIMTISDVIEGTGTVVSDWGSGNLRLTCPYSYSIDSTHYW